MLGCLTLIDSLLMLIFALVFQCLFKSLASSKLQRLTLFENFDQKYALALDVSKIVDKYSELRIPTSDVSYAVAKASRKLEYLSASFIVDARLFFDACKPSWGWPSKTSLVLTSQLLTPDERLIDVDNMLQKAATVAMKMPTLRSTEIWRGRRGLAMLFRYQITEKGLRC